MAQQTDDGVGETELVDGRAATVVLASNKESIDPEVNTDADDERR